MCVTSVDIIRTPVVDVIGQLIHDVIGRLSVELTCGCNSLGRLNSVWVQTIYNNSNPYVINTNNPTSK